MSDSDSPLKRLLRNTGVLLSGTWIGSLMNFVSLALTARALGPASFGVLAMVQAFARTVDRLLNFQSSLAVIKYGTEANEGGRRAEFQQVIKFGTLLDVSTAVLGTVVALSLMKWGGSLVGWSHDVSVMAAFYTLAILFNLSGTPRAVLRLFDRFRLLAAQQVMTAALRLIAALIALRLESNLPVFVGIWLCAEIFGHLLLLAFSWQVLGKNGYGLWSTMRAPLRGVTQTSKGIWSFVWTTNINSSLKMGLKELDVLMVGGVLGEAAAGLYKVARQAVKALDDLTGPLQQAIYPELARLWARGEGAAMRKVVVRSGMIAGGAAFLAWILCLAWGRPAIGLAFGTEFVEAQTALVGYLLAVVISSAGIGLSPTLLTIGRPKTILLANIFAALIYFPALWGLMRTFGLAGAGAAYVAYYVCWVSVMCWGLRGAQSGSDPRATRK